MKTTIDDLYFGMTYLANEMAETVKNPVIGAKTDGERKMEKFCKDMIADFSRQLERCIHEFEHVRDAVKPILEYDFGDYMPPWKPLRINGESISGAVTTDDGHAFSLIEECIFGIDAMVEMANLIGALQKELKPRKEEEVDCG